MNDSLGREDELEIGEEPQAATIIEYVKCRSVNALVVNKGRLRPFLAEQKPSAKMPDRSFAF